MKEQRLECLVQDLCLILLSTVGMTFTYLYTVVLYVDLAGWRRRRREEEGSGFEDVRRVI